MLRKKLSDKNGGGSFGAYRVAVEGFGNLTIFARSSEAAEQVGRRLLSGAGGPWEFQKEKKKIKRTLRNDTNILGRSAPTLISLEIDSLNVRFRQKQTQNYFV